MPTSSPDLTGVLLERRYRLDAILVDRGSSTVYRGTDIRLGRAIAVEVATMSRLSDPAFLGNFENAVRAAAQLRHPAVVAVLDQCVEGDQVCLVTELIDGGTLRDLLARRGKLEPAVAMSVLGPVLSALSAALRAGLVHGDVTPENVLIGTAQSAAIGGQVKLAGFGMVHLSSPEQTDRGVRDARGDVYAAGALLYEMLAGAALHGDRSLRVPDLNASAPSIAGVPLQLDTLVRRATRRDPALRPADATAFLAELERVGAELGLRPQPVPLPHTPLAQDPTIVLSAVTVGVMPSAAAEQTLPVRARAAATRRPQTRRTPPHARKTDQVTEKRRRAILWTSVAAVLALVTGSAWWWLEAGRWTSVPQVGGQTETSAMAQVREASLSAQVLRVPSDDVPNGNVLRTEPGSGTEILEGSSITVYVSRGRPAVPFLSSGVEVEAATKDIEAAGLKAVVDETKNAYSDTVPAGKVLGLDPRAGTQLPIGASVALLVSKGPAPKKPVPNVAGMTKDEALAELQRNGLQGVEGPAEFSAGVEAGRVIRTDPPPGTMLGPGQESVAVVVSNAISVPEVRGKPIRDARAELQALGLQVTVASPNGDEAPCGAQSIEPGQRVQPGAAVTIAGV